jgi:ferrous iron transport protein A
VHPRGVNNFQSSVCCTDRDGRILNYDQSGRSFDRLPFRQPSGVRRLSALSELKIGESGVLVALDLPESVQNHLMHMGFVPDARVKALRRAPAGDPTVYGIDGMEIALRRETAEAIQMRPALELPTELRAAGREGASAPDLIEAAR